MAILVLHKSKVGGKGGESPNGQPQGTQKIRKTFCIFGQGFASELATLDEATNFSPPLVANSKN